VGGLIARAELTETRNNLDAVKQTILGFAQRTQRLPKYTLVVSPNDGRDELSSRVPVMNDFWQRRLVYIYDNELARSDLGSDSGPICSKLTTNLRVRNCVDAACTAGFTDTENVALVVFSSGKNGVNQTGSAVKNDGTTDWIHTEPAPYASYSGATGVFGAAGLKLIKVYPTGASVGAFDAPTANPQGYDDIVHVITLDELRQRAGCSAKPLRLVNGDLPIGSSGASYQIDLLSDGGIPVSATENFRWCVESAQKALVDADVSFSVKQRTALDYSPNRVLNVQNGLNLCTAAGASETDPAIWVTGDVLRITGASGGNLGTGGARTRTIKVFVRDNQNNDTGLAGQDTLDNIQSRMFVIPINGT
jgi:hypothetical protein